MRRLAQRVDDDGVEVFKQGQARVRDDAHIGEVGCVAEAETSDFQLAVKKGDALEGGSVNGDGLMAFKTMHANAGPRRILGLSRKRVVEYFFDDAGTGLIGI